MGRPKTDRPKTDHGPIVQECRAARLPFVPIASELWSLASGRSDDWWRTHRRCKETHGGAM